MITPSVMIIFFTPLLSCLRRCHYAYDDLFRHAAPMFADIYAAEAAAAISSF